MHEISFYTTIFAPAAFFLFGVVAVIMLNKFIGARSDQNTKG